MSVDETATTTTIPSTSYVAQLLPVGPSDAAVTNTRDVPVAAELKYACIMCRRVMASSKDNIPHEQGLDQLKSLGRARNDVEFDSSNTIFVHEVDWMKTQADEGRASSSTNEGKLDCPHCGAKVCALASWLYPPFFFLLVLLVLG